MSNLYDYLNWRGDLSLGSASLCPVDALILSMLPYIRLEGTVPASPAGEPVRLSDAAAAYFASPAERTEAEKHHHALLARLAKTPRFASLRLVGAQQEKNEEAGIQFAAVTVLLPGQNLFVAFEGTDDTLLGWQEDFRMSYECPVPAQLRAVRYLREVAAAHPLRRIFVGGHSKGGNLAMYASVYCGEEFRYRIRRVFNNDGPGFCDDTLSSPAYREMRARISTFLPQSSIVGVLLEHDDNYKIVKSTNLGLAQHNPYSWEIEGPDFVYTTERTAFGLETEAVVDRFINDFSPERKREFGEALFSILESTEQKTVSGITGNKLQSVRRILSSYAGLDDEVRDVLHDALTSLNRARKSVRREREELRAALTDGAGEKSS